MTALDLDAIKVRAEKATVGPWQFKHRPGYKAYDSEVVATTLIPLDLAPEIAEVLDADDAEFIAHAREDVPALVAEVERLRRNVLSAVHGLDHSKRYAPSEIKRSVYAALESSDTGAQS